MNFPHSNLSQGARELGAQSKTCAEPFGCAQDKLCRKDRQSKGTNCTNRVGYRSGDCYPTLFGWDICKRPAYFTPDHDLSNAVRGSESISKSLFTAETPSSQSSEYLLIKNYLLGVLRASAVQGSRNCLRTNMWQAKCQLRKLHSVCGKYCNDGGILDIGIKARAKAKGPSVAILIHPSQN